MHFNFTWKSERIHWLLTSTTSHIARPWAGSDADLASHSYVQLWCAYVGPDLPSTTQLAPVEKLTWPWLRVRDYIFNCFLFLPYIFFINYEHCFNILSLFITLLSYSVLAYCIYCFMLVKEFKVGSRVSYKGGQGVAPLQKLKSLASRDP